MSVVRILSDRVANQIAAGEVVERPASIVKELIENALDAGATRIEVEFRNGGRSYIRVEDNGCGMSRDDALLSLERHATSKIRAAEDLDHVLSFGFRGEALPSIASVSRFTLQTRDAAAEEGSEILINGGRMVHVRECGMPAGTRIVVSHLFNSVPARRKFLKSDVTETAHIVHCCRLYALASPQVSFSVLESGRQVFQSPVCASLRERIAEVFHKQLADDLIPVEAQDKGLVLEGLLSRPGVARSTRHEMITFVNRRPVESRTLAYALLESYQSLVPKGRYPMAFLFLGIGAAGVDVNVHPAKREVRFRDESRVRGFTIRAVLEALRQSGGAGAPASDPRTHRPVTSQPADRPAVNIDRPSVAVKTPSSARPAERSSVSLPPVASGGPDRAATSISHASSGESTRSGWRRLGAVDGGYVLFERTDGLVVLDRHAAVERVWYERLLAQYRDGKVASQRLLLPVPLELDAIAAAALSERLSFLQEHGLEIAPFGRDFFRIEAIPVWMEPSTAESFVRDVVGWVRSGRLTGRDLQHAREQLARAAAARVAAASRSESSPEALEALVVELLRCENPHTNPAGRPVFIQITAGELQRRFHKQAAGGDDLGLDG